MNPLMNAPLMSPTRILIVDDVPQVRAELRNLLSLESRIEIAGEAADGLEAVTQTRALHPDVVLMDLEMPLLDGYEATRRIKNLYPACRVVVLTLHSYATARDEALQAGADFIVEKGEPFDRLVQAILYTKE